MDSRTACLDLSGIGACALRRIAGMRGAINSVREFMETKPGFIQLISAVIGLSLGVSVMTATVLLGMAALFQ